MKNDISVGNICTAAFKRKTINPIEFQLTKLFETELISELSTDITHVFIRLDNELPISQTFVDRTNWALVTTRRIISCINKEIQETFADEINSWDWDDFKGISKKAIDW